MCIRLLHTVMQSECLSRRITHRNAVFVLIMQSFDIHVLPSSSCSTVVVGQGVLAVQELSK